uniref:Uncharacterized protein n=1 Tax=Culex tarsalis TaxID=7177 RepID=A0A1Q3G006_CULTA
MWPSRRFRPLPPQPVLVDSETLAKSPHKIRFNLFHRRSKDIVCPAKKPASDGKDDRCREENRPKVNLFPQISLNDVRGKELENVLDFTYGSDWKEASTFTATVSWMNLGQIPEVRDADATKQYSERFRRQTGKVEPFDLPTSEVNLSKWYRKSEGLTK